MNTRKSARTRPKSSNSTRSAKTNAPANKPAKKSGTSKRKPAARAATPRGDEAPAVWTLRLYITGRGERSERALRNLRNLCEANMKEGTYKIEVIDLLKNPALAKTDQILAIPTLVRKLPEPMKRIIGDLSDADRALVSLDLMKQP